MRASNLIKKGKHYDSQLFSSWPHIGQKSMSRYVTFDKSWRYTLPAYNQTDVNKLFGLSFGFFALHKDSARFGAYYLPSEDVVCCVPYCYVDGKRNSDEQLVFPITYKAHIDERVKLTIDVDKSHYIFTAAPPSGGALFSYVENKQDLPCYGATHGLYWGGSTLAPHDIYTDIRKSL